MAAIQRREFPDARQSQDGQHQTQDAAQNPVLPDLHQYQPGRCASDASDGERQELSVGAIQDHPERQDHQNPDSRNPDQDADAGRSAYAARPEAASEPNTWDAVPSAA